MQSRERDKNGNKNKNKSKNKNKNKSKRKKVVILKNDKDGKGGRRQHMGRVSGKQLEQFDAALGKMSRDPKHNKKKRKDV